MPTPRQTQLLRPMALPNALRVKLGTQYVRVFDAAALQFGAEDFSVLAWVLPDAQTPSGQNYSIMGKDSTTGWSLLSIGPSGKYGFGIRNLATFVSAGSVYPSGQWAMVAGGHDQAAAQIWASVNGAAAVTTSRATAPTAGTGDLAIGTGATFTGANFNGLILRVGIWRRKVTADVTELYNGGVPLRYADLSSSVKTSLEAWWDLNELTGQNRRESHAGLYHGFDAGLGVEARPGLGPLVASPAPTKILVCDGDSLTAGYDGASYIPWYSYPSQTVLNLGTAWSLANIGVSGYQTVQILANVTTRVDGLRVASAAKNVLVVWIGVNDLLNATALATIKTNIQTYISGRQSAGFYVIICTLTPSQYVSRPGSYDADLASLNVWILAGSSGANAVCDSGSNAALNNPADGVNYNADKLHLTKLGYKIVATDVTTKVAAA